MSEALFGFPIRSDVATLSGGSWLTALPLANLQTPSLGTVARSSNDDNASTIINVDFGSAQFLRVIALVRSNIQAAAQWRIRASANSDMSSAVYDSTWIDCWPVQWPENLLPEGHPNASDRKLTNADIARLRWDIVRVLPAGTSARYWRIEIDDDANTDGYIEIGRLVMAPAYQPSHNMNLGVELGARENSVVDESLSGVTLVDARAKRRTASMQFTWLDTDEALLLNELRTQWGYDQQVYFVFDPDDTYHLQRRSFLAQQRELSPMQIAFHGTGDNAVALDEVL